MSPEIDVIRFVAKPRDRERVTELAAEGETSISNVIRQLIKQEHDRVMAKSRL